jgi:hypothetical protein
MIFNLIMVSYINCISNSMKTMISRSMLLLLRCSYLTNIKKIILLMSQILIILLRVKIKKAIKNLLIAYLDVKKNVKNLVLNSFLSSNFIIKMKFNMKLFGMLKLLPKKLKFLIMLQRKISSKIQIKI